MNTKICPGRDEGGRSSGPKAFKDFCRRLRIPLKIEEDLPALKTGSRQSFCERADTLRKKNWKSFLEIVDDCRNLTKTLKHAAAPMVGYMLKEFKAEQDQLPNEGRKG